jgi:hypothetical protein
MEIRHAGMRIATEAGDAAIPALAYPYGEYESNIKQVVEDLGYFALGQHSGAAGFDSDFHALPRFPVASGLDSVDEIALRVRTRPLVIELVEPERHISDGGSPPLEGIVRSSDVHRDQMACYAGGQGRMDLQWIDIDSGRFIARPASPLRPGRTKYNCTAPSVSDTGVYHWFSYLWMTKRPSGHWYD